MVVVRGEAGIGKTRLVEKFMTIAHDLGFSHHKALVLPDFDFDGDVDLHDYDLFQDGDLHDYAFFQAAFTGSQ